MEFTKHPPVVRGMYLTIKTGWARPPYPTLRIDFVGANKKLRRTTRTVYSDEQLYKAVQVAYKARQEMALKCAPENPRLAYKLLKEQLAVALKETEKAAA